MNKKLTITKDQEKALLTYINKDKPDKELGKFIRMKGEYVGAFEFLNDLTVEEYALLLCDWYEVAEPIVVDGREIQPGDILSHSGYVFEVKEIDHTKHHSVIFEDVDGDEDAFIPSPNLKFVCQYENRKDIE